MSNAIETVDLTRRFGRRDAVDHLTLQVPSGSVYALVGPNGAGKTTTIKLLLNLIRPTQGAARILGVDSSRLDVPTLQRIGYVSENQHLPDHLTPQGLLDYCKPFYPSWDDGLARRLRATLNLPTETRLKHLSRGTRMKAALLSALAFRPDLLVLDEPFSGLDPLVRDELVHGLLELANERPWTVFISSHDIEEVERIADWVGFLDGGQLQFAEPITSLLQRFRLIEVIGQEHAPPAIANPAWIATATAGRTLRFVDTQHDASAEARLSAAFGGAEIRITPMSLRDIFVSMARLSLTAQQRQGVEA
jgi:ABC-2 type transport system ATP-binding protein